MAYGLIMAAIVLLVDIVAGILDLYAADGLLFKFLALLKAAATIYASCY